MGRAVYLEAFSDNPFDTNCWLLAADGSDDAVVVDPGFFPDRILRLLDEAGKRPVAVLATHGHFDHIGAAEALCGRDIPFHIHKEDEQALSDPEGWGSSMPVPPVRPGIVHTFVDGDALDVAGFQVEVLHTPGHTPGSSCFRIPELLFSGDLVFAGAIGRSDFANSSPRAMVASLRRFLELPDDLVVHPGHGPSTTVG
jgi:glyoxylase-like metal-dependent hydrolase (beta-lactamase superfamily II)